PRRVVVAAGGGAVVVALAVLLAAGTLGGAFGPSPSPRPSGTGSLGLVGLGSPSAAASGPTAGSPAASGPLASPAASTYLFGFAGAQDGVIGKDAGGDAELAAGQYAEADYGLPHLTMTLGTGWSLVNRSGTSVGLIRSDDPNDFVGFAWPTRVPNDACATSTRPLSANPSDYTVWLQQTAALSVTPSIARYFGALAAQQADLSVVVKSACASTDPPAIRISPPVPAGGGLGTDQGEFWPAGSRYRIAYGDLGGRLLRILIEAPDDQTFQSFDPLVESILTTIGVAPAASGP
ncbi:MAG: hypothetical protein ACHQZR_08715, partial [Candidatus Limnocylindrales bacterium]